MIGIVNEHLTQGSQGAFMISGTPGLGRSLQ